MQQKKTLVKVTYLEMVVSYFNAMWNKGICRHPTILSNGFITAMQFYYFMFSIVQNTTLQRKALLVS